MKYIRQFGIILAVSFIGETLNAVIPLPVPASIYGIVIMFICLKTGIIPVESVRETSMFLIEIMPLMFIPAAVGLVTSWDMMKSSLVPYIVITVVSTVAVMAVSGIVTQMIIRNKNGGGNSDE